MAKSNKKLEQSNGIPASGGAVKLREITQEMQESYLDYAMSVIVARALPDVRDGLKPVHRRILYTMNEMGLHHGNKYRKSAAVVGNILAKYHPHGDVAVYDSMVRMAQDFAMRYPLVDGQGNFGCFTSDTKVSLADGRDLSFAELIKEHKGGKRNYTYTFNHETNSVEVAEIKNPRLTRKKADLVEISLDNGQKIKCTPDHKFMLRDGGYKEAQFLKREDSLMPAYFRLSTQEDDKNVIGYRMIWQPVRNVWDWAHRIADKWNLKNRVYQRSAGRIRHHKDFNKLNNNPDNIARIQWRDHWALHYKLASERHKNDPEYVRKLAEGRQKYINQNRHLFAERIRKLNKKLWSSRKFRKEHRERIQKLWADPDYKEFMRKISSKGMKEKWQDENYRKFMGEFKSKEMRARWQNKSYRKHMAEHMKNVSNEIWANPEHREYMSKLMSLRMNTPEMKKKQSDFSKKLWEDPNFRAKYPKSHFIKMAKALWSNPVFKKLHSEKARKQWDNPEFRKKVSEATRERNLKRLKEQPDLMKRLAKKSALSLRKKWRSPEYKDQVVKSKILRYAKNLLDQGYPKITPAIYEKNRNNDGTPNINNALKYFPDLKEIVNQAQKYNHKVVLVRFLKKREDVYDLTTEPWHNFLLDAGVFVHNSIDGDSPAAQRYTEARLTKISDEILADIEKDTVNFIDNYDSTTKEPTVLPSRIPNLLMNGSVGIAVGMATNIPPHNLGELVDGLIYLTENEDADVNDLINLVKGPDFPTGGTIYNEKDILQAFATGKGPVVMRGKAEIVENKKGFQILISEIPYQVNKASLVENIADLVKSKKLEGIRDLRDESGKEGIRVVIDLKQDAFPRKVLNALYKYTELQKVFHYNMLALTDGIQPQILSLKSILEKFIEHRKVVIIRRAQFDLNKAKERAHILEGLNKALDHIDEVIKVIKKSESKEDAFNNLIKRFKFSDRQTQAILEMRLQTLAGLERKKIEDELKEKKELIAYLEGLLRSPKKILGVMKDEFREIKKTYVSERKTRIVKSPLKEIGEEELVPEQDSLFMITRGGYIKRMDPGALRVQKRGGKGLIGMATKEEDVVSHFFLANTHDNILFFTNSGKVFQTKGYEVPESSRTAKGKAIVNFLNIGPNDVITAAVPISKEDKGMFLFMTTAGGIIKKVPIDAFQNVRASGLIAINLKGDDRLLWVRSTSGKDQIVMVSSDGSSIRFKESDVRPMGRTASGVIGMRLPAAEVAPQRVDPALASKSGVERLSRKDTERPNAKISRREAISVRGQIVGMEVIDSSLAEKDLKLLVVMKNGYGKRTELRHYKVQKRGGKGVLTAKITSKTGEIVSAHITDPELKEIIAVSEKGVIIRTALESISVLSRATQGVRIMKMEAGDSVASVEVY